MVQPFYILIKTKWLKKVYCFKYFWCYWLKMYLSVYIKNINCKQESLIQSWNNCLPATLYAGNNLLVNFVSSINLYTQIHHYDFIVDHNTVLLCKGKRTSCVFWSVLEDRPRRTVKTCSVVVKTLKWTKLWTKLYLVWIYIIAMLQI